MTYQAQGATDVGKVRDHNEDNLLVDPDLGLFIVCDGMGGHAAGEVASQMAVDKVKEYVTAERATLEQFRADPSSAQRDIVKQLLATAVAEASSAVYQAAAEDSDKKGMGTTLVMMLVVDDHAFVAHVGDSRLYLVRKDAVYQLTEDHSLMNDAIKNGGMTRAEAAKLPFASKLTQAVGYREFVKTDLLLLELMDGDRYLLCSDGLCNFMSNEDLSAISETVSHRDMPARLIELANSRGGTDNITAVVVQVGASAREPTQPREVTVARKVDALKRIPLFAKLRYKELARLLEIISVKRLTAGEVVIAEGSMGEEMYILLNGEVEVMRGDEVAATLGPGHHFGEMSLIDRQPRSATVRSAGDSRIMAIQKEPLFALLQKEPRLGMKVFWAFLQSMNRRLREQDRELRSQLVEEQGSDDAPFWE